MTWDKATFPRPAELQDDIASRGRKIVASVDPHIKRDPAYPIFKDAQERGHYVRNKDGKDYEG
jgi:alpha 1,3-glucosidase